MYVDAFEKHVRGQEGNDDAPAERDRISERDRVSNLLDKLTGLVSKLNCAIQTPE